MTHLVPICQANAENRDESCIKKRWDDCPGASGFLHIIAGLLAAGESSSSFGLGQIPIAGIATGIQSASLPLDMAVVVQDVRAFRMTLADVERLHRAGVAVPVDLVSTGASDRREGARIIRLAGSVGVKLSAFSAVVSGIRVHRIGFRQYDCAGGGLNRRQSLLLSVKICDGSNCLDAVVGVINQLNIGVPNGICVKRFRGINVRADAVRAEVEALRFAVGINYLRPVDTAGGVSS